MAMRTATPWWASLAFGTGLLSFLLGERLFSHLPGWRFLLTGLGLLLVLGITATRAWAMMASAGARRRVERTLLVSHAGTVFALFLYLLSTDWGTTKLGLGETAAAHFHGAVTVLYLAVLIGSIVPLLMVELSLGVALRTGFDVQAGPGNEEAGVEYFRVREIGWSGLSVGLALSFLMVTCQVASERNIQRDVSYFKTSSPGESTQKIVAAASDPLKVLLFFPESSEVKNQVRGYFEALAAMTSKISVEQRDRLADAELAGKYKVVKDGTMVFVRGTGDKEKSQVLDIDIDTAKMRSPASKLRNLDREVNAVLLKLMRDKRKAYVLTGHGELNDPDSIPAELKSRGERPTSLFKRRLSDLNYEVKNLGLMDLVKDVPDDATIVIVFAPSVPLQQSEWDALVRYLDRGGRLMVILDPTGNADMGPLESKFAFKMAPGHLTDDQNVLTQRGTLSDRRFTLTNQFSAHSSTTSLSRTSAEKGLPLIQSGALEDLPYKGKGEDAPKKTITIRSLETSFMDLNDNFVFDSAGPTPEKRQKWNIAAAVEGPRIGDKDGYRALLFANSNLFVDFYVRNQIGQVTSMLVSGTLLDDSIHWLGGEESVVGEVVSEDDKAITHTKSEDVLWFTLMLIGAPIIVLTLGLIGTWARRRRGSKKTEVTL